MNTSTIEKAIALYDSANLEELRNLLIYEREKSILESSGKKMKLAPIVKNILNRNKKIRPVLATVMYDEQNRPCICDGYLLIRWNKEQQELKAFPETRGEQVLKADNIIPKQEECEERKLTEDDQIILKNIEKYIKLYANDKINKMIPVCLFGKTFDAYLVRDLISVIGKDFERTYTKRSSSKYAIYENYPDIIFKNDLQAVILPCRTAKDEDKTNNALRTQTFIEKIKAQEE